MFLHILNIIHIIIYLVFSEYYEFKNDIYLINVSNYWVIRRIVIKAPTNLSNLILVVFENFQHHVIINYFNKQ